MSEWNEWRPGDYAPLSPFEPIEIKWHNGLTRIYEFGQYIAWKNLTRPLQWRKPVPPKKPMPIAICVVKIGSVLRAREHEGEIHAGETMYVKQP